MRRHPSLSILAAIACACVALQGTAKDPVIETASGQVQGRVLPRGAGAVFRGLPFARPPIGAWRWRAPEPPAPWTGVRDAGESRPPCAQSSAGWNAKEAAASQEDCLYLDVWTPQWSPTSRAPVMVWLHGGGNTGGAGGSDPLYDGTELVSRGVVLVVVDYRLGIFGFLAHPELTRESPHHASGNYALLDQIAALEWVRRNIVRFGGDPANVTLFGQSAGAMDVGVLMTSPLARGLFHRAIAQSGAARRATPLADAEREGRRTAEGLGAPSAGAVAHLRSLSTADLLKARAPASAVLDGWVLASQPDAAFTAGAAHPVPLVIGSNAIEFAGSGGPASVRSAILSRYGVLAPRALALYGLSAPGDAGVVDPLYGGPDDQWGADTSFRCPGILQGERHAAAGHGVWQYQFDRAIPPKPHVVHSGELAYVFGNLWSSGSQAGAFEEADRTLSSFVQRYWTNFARSGDPNGAGVPPWPRYDAGQRRFLEFTRAADVVAGANQRRAFCELFAEAENRRGAR
jgi:para-nitrobenzyl esterase